jgi:uncharacterized protein YaaQ
MKLILVILRDDDSENVNNALIHAGFRVTQIASTGGFLRRGSTTFMIGVDDDKVDDAIQVVNDNCSLLIEPGLKRATMFVLNIENFTQV